MKKMLLIMLLSLPILMSCGKKTFVTKSYELNGVTFVDVEPQMGLAYEYSGKSGHTVFIVLAVLIIAFGAYYGYCESQDMKVFSHKSKSSRSIQSGAVTAVLVFLIWIAGGVVWVAKPFSVRYNNAKQIEVGRYEWYKAKDDNFKSFWDSIYYNNKMHSAASR